MTKEEKSDVKAYEAFLRRKQAMHADFARIRRAHNAEYQALKMYTVDVHGTHVYQYATNSEEALQIVSAMYPDFRCKVVDVEDSVNFTLCPLSRVGDMPQDRRCPDSVRTIYRTKPKTPYN